MNPIRTIRRPAAGLAFAWLGLAVAAPAAFAAVSVPPPSGGSARVTLPAEPPGWNKHPPLPVLGPNRTGYPSVSHVHTVVAGGMPGSQIALIAVAAALLVATAAVLAHRAWTARRKPVTAAAEPNVAGADARLLSAP